MLGKGILIDIDDLFSYDLPVPDFRLWRAVHARGSTGKMKVKTQKIDKVVGSR